MDILFFFDGLGAESAVVYPAIQRRGDASKKVIIEHTEECAGVVSALAGFEVVGCGEEVGCEVRAEVGVFGGEVVGVLGGGEGWCRGAGGGSDVGKEEGASSSSFTTNVAIVLSALSMKHPMLMSWCTISGFCEGEALGALCQYHQ
eukprot:scaffold1928_cov109-Alexandrium_tamarense.AAC.31